MKVFKQLSTAFAVFAVAFACCAETNANGGAAAPATQKIQEAEKLTKKAIEKLDKQNPGREEIVQSVGSLKSACANLEFALTAIRTLEQTNPALGFGTNEPSQISGQRTLAGIKSFAPLAAALLALVSIVWCWRERQRSNQIQSALEIKLAGLRQIEERTVSREDANELKWRLQSLEEHLRQLSPAPPAAPNARRPQPALPEDFSPMPPAATPSDSTPASISPRELLSALLKAMDAKGEFGASNRDKEVDLEYIGQLLSPPRVADDLIEPLGQLNLIAPDSKNAALSARNFLTVASVRSRKIVRVSVDALKGLRELKSLDKPSH